MSEATTEAGRRAIDHAKRAVAVYVASIEAEARAGALDVEVLRSALDRFMTERGEYRGITAEKLHVAVLAILEPKP